MLRRCMFSEVGCVPEGKECQLADAWISEVTEDVALLSVTTLLPGRAPTLGTTVVHLHHDNGSHV